MRRIYPEAGEETELDLKLRANMPAQYDLELGAIVEPGTFRILIGGSSKGLHLKTEPEVR